MSKAVKMAKVSAKGGFHLFWGLAASSIISAVGIVLVARLLSPPEYGLYTIAMTAPNLIILFRDWGVNTAMIRYIAQHNSENKMAKVKSILMAGALFETILGLSLTVLSFLLAGSLAIDVFKRPGIKLLIEIASLTVLGDALVTVAQSVLIGLEKMVLNNITIILQSCLKALFMPVLIILGLGAFGATLGATTAFLLTGLVSILILLDPYKKLQKPGDKLKIADDIKTMFKYGLPLSISAILSGFLTQFYNFLMAIYATDLMIGNYSVATNFTALMAFFALPISTILLPTFSKLDLQKEKETMRNVFQFSVKYAAFLVVPVTAAVMALCQPAIFTLFGEEYSEAPLFLALIAVNYLYSAFGSLSVGNLINSQEKTRVILLLNLVTAVIGLPLGIVLIPRFGVIGLIITNLAAGIPSQITGLYWIKTHFGATVDWTSSTKILLASGTAAAITYIVLSQLSFSSWIKLIIGGAIFLLAFLTSILLTKTINKQDINNLKEMTSELGPLNHILNSILNIIEKLITVFQS